MEISATEVGEKESTLGGIVIDGKSGGIREEADRSLRRNLKTFSEKNVAKSCERGSGWSCRESRCEVRCWR